MLAARYSVCTGSNCTATVGGILSMCSMGILLVCREHCNDSSNCHILTEV